MVYQVNQNIWRTTKQEIHIWIQFLGKKYTLGLRYGKLPLLASTRISFGVSVLFNFGLWRGLEQVYTLLKLTIREQQ